MMAEAFATDRRALIAATERALVAAEAVLRTARARVLERVTSDGTISPAALDSEQIAVHGFAWMATYVEALRQIRQWAVRLDDAGEFGETEALILAVAFGDYLAQLAGGIAMAQSEIARPHDLGLAEDELGPLRTGDAGRLVRGLGDARARLAGLLADGSSAPYGHIGLGDPTLGMIRDQIARFAELAVAPFAQEWHRRDQLIPIAKPHVPTVCNTMWALTDFTEANGATRIVPGSHRAGQSPVFGEHYDSIPAEMPRGSVLVWHGSLWHGGGANRTDRRRVGIAMNYCAGWIRQQENQQLGIPLETVRGFEPRLQELCGFGLYSGLIGHVDKRAPMERLFGERPGGGMIWDYAGKRA